MSSVQTVVAVLPPIPVLIAPPAPPVSLDGAPPVSPDVVPPVSPALVEPPLSAPPVASGVDVEPPVALVGVALSLLLEEHACVSSIAPKRLEARNESLVVVFILLHLAEAVVANFLARVGARS